MTRIIDVSGYSFSGKSALVQLLHEFERAIGDDIEVEFDFIRAPGGMLDLYLNTACAEHWSPIRASDAVSKMYRLIHAMGGGRSFTDRIRRGGPSYDFFYPGFTKNAHYFVRSLVEAHYRAEWPYTNFGRDPWIASLRKLARRLKVSRTEEIFFLRPSKKKFFDASHAFFSSLVDGRCASSQTLITNNALEPYAPKTGLAIMGCGVSLIVDRDPRDIYLSARTAGRVNGVDVGNATVGSSVETFVARFTAQRSNVENDDDVIRLHFEDVVEKYEEVVIELTKRLPLGEHVRRGLIFNPSFSRGNVRAWEKTSNRELLADIGYIEKHLSNYLRETGK